MSNVKKQIEKLDLMDDFLFTEASTDPETAPLLMRLIIERATGVKVGKMNIEPQLAHRLLEEERFEDLKRVTRDKAYLAKMLEEFGIK